MGIRRWVERLRLRQAFSILSLCFMVYLGITRVRSIMQADACVEAGGSYDEQNGVCRHR